MLNAKYVPDDPYNSEQSSCNIIKFLSHATCCTYNFLQRNMDMFLESWSTGFPLRFHVASKKFEFKCCTNMFQDCMASTRFSLMNLIQSIYPLVIYIKIWTFCEQFILMRYEKIRSRLDAGLHGRGFLVIAFYVDS